MHSESPGYDRYIAPAEELYPGLSVAPVII